MAIQITKNNKNEIQRSLKIMKKAIKNLDFDFYAYDELSEVELTQIIDAIEVIKALKN
jgi:ATP:corrinoid adenosyltransferase